MRRNPHEPFKIDQKFGAPVSYGPHEGWDTNGLAGGNTDCNTPLYPLIVDSAKATFTSVATTGYGRMLVYEVSTPRGSRWIRYAHLNEVLVKVGDMLNENTPVAKMGSTGNSTACHLHWDIFKKIPPNWRWYPKTTTELHEYMIDPQEFIDVYKDYKPTPSTEMVPKSEWQIERDERNKNWDLYQKERLDHTETKKELSLVKEQVSQATQHHKDDLEKIGNILQVPADITKIIPALETCITFEDKARDLEKKLEEERAQYASDLDKLTKQITVLKKGLADAEAEVERLKEEKPEMVVTQSLLQKILGKLGL